MLDLKRNSTAISMLYLWDNFFLIVYLQFQVDFNSQIKDIDKKFTFTLSLDKINIICHFFSLRNKVKFSENANIVVVIHELFYNLS